MVDRRWSLLARCFAAALLGAAPAARAADNLTYVSLPPCRVIDTRVSGAGGPLVAATPRSFVFRGPTINYQNPVPFPNQGGSTTGCGIPDLTLDGANQRNIVKAVAINIVAVGPAGAGDLRAWAANQPLPNASVINYTAVAGLNIANGVIVPMCNQVSATPCTAGDITFLADVSGTHLVVDVVGYFESEAATVFSQFGGDGSSGALHVTSSTTRSAARQQYTSLTVDAGTTLTMARPFTFVGVQGTCTIAGTISVNGLGASGGAGANASASPIGLDGNPGMDGTTSNPSSLQLSGCIAGSGGGGGFAGSQKGGAGGGAGGLGGSAFAGTGLRADFNGLTAGASGYGAGDTRTSSFPALLTCTGAGGGGGGAEPGLTGGNGGNGGGVLYLECGALNCSGALTARGTPGAAGTETNGGGGGGGVILVRTRQLISATCLPAIDITGGTGGGLGGSGFFDVVVLP